MKRRIFVHAAGGAILGLAVGAFSLHVFTKDANSAELPAPEAPSGGSLHQLASVWTTDQSRPLRFRDLGGRFQVVAMIFTHCPGACPTLVRELRAFEEALPDELQDDIGFVLVTIDPKRDTPELLRAYRDKLQLPANWTLLRGSPEDIRELAATLGFNYEPDDAMGFVHSRLVTVLEPRGEIVHQQAGIAGDPERVIAAIEKRR